MGSFSAPAPKSTLTALVKGAGPTGLASAAALAHLGIQVTVVEKRPRRSSGHGRKNVVAIRPEARRNLETLGALEYLVAHNSFTDMTWGHTYNEWDGSVFDWTPLFQRYPSVKVEESEVETEYVVPGKISEQLPSSYVHLGDLEDALLEVCERHGVKVLHEATIRLRPTQIKQNAGLGGNQDSDSPDTKYVASLVKLHPDANRSTAERAEHDTMTPDLVVCASGKSDGELVHDLGFRRHVGVELGEDSLPELSSGSDAESDSPHTTNVRNLRLREDGEIESQHYAVFGVRYPQRPLTTPTPSSHETTNGHITHYVRKNGTGAPPQPLIEITMSHKDVTHLIIHLPRDLDLNTNNKSALESYVVDRVNAKLETGFTSVQDMRDKDAIFVGDPLTPILVETATAPKFVFGSNVVLVGDAAMSCSPASGLGADIGMTADSRSISLLGSDLVQITESMDSTGDASHDRQWEEALNRFNRRKAESAIIWSQGSRVFYITGNEAKDILQQIELAREEEAAANR